MATRKAALRARMAPRARERAIRAGYKGWSRIGSRRVANIYHRDLIYRTGNFRTLRWLGVPIWQNLVDLWTTQEAIHSVKPSLRPGPLSANRDFLDRHPEFAYDRELNEQFGLSQHPLGWMRRVTG